MKLHEHQPSLHIECATLYLCMCLYLCDTVFVFVSVFVFVFVPHCIKIVPHQPHAEPVFATLLSSFNIKYVWCCCILYIVFIMFSMFGAVYNSVYL